MFKNNTVTRSHRFEPYHRRKYTFSFEASKNISISNNTFSEDLLGKNIHLKDTERSELKLGVGQNLTIED